MANRSPGIVRSDGYPHATFYVRHLETALTRGVPRSYQETQERLAGIRGRVDLPAQLRLAGPPLPAECRFDEYTADIPLNRILRGAAVRLLRLPGVTIPTRQALQRLAAQLGEADVPTPADLQARTMFTRLTEHCRPAERLARMVLGASSLLDAAGATGAAVFLIDMNKAFEDFVAARLTRYLSGQLIVHTQRSERLDTAKHIKIRPDIIFERRPGVVAYIADSKYKITDDGYGREADYYQILAYTSALRVPEGMLIYCHHDGSAPPRNVTVRNLGTRLSTWALRFDLPPATSSMNSSHWPRTSPNARPPRKYQLRRSAADLRIRLTEAFRRGRRVHTVRQQAWAALTRPDRYLAGTAGALREGM